MSFTLEALSIFRESAGPYKWSPANLTAAMLTLPESENSPEGGFPGAEGFAQGSTGDLLQGMHRVLVSTKDKGRDSRGNPPGLGDKARSPAVFRPGI